MIDPHVMAVGPSYRALTHRLLTLRKPADDLIEVCFGGPAGTGKTVAILLMIHALCSLDLWPNLRVLIARQTRRSLTESVLATFENIVVQRGHPVLRGPQRAQRGKYVYPNGPEIILGGFDNPTRMFSTEFDIAYLPEANEIKHDDQQSVFRAMRNTGWPGKAIIMDTNPDSAQHWIYTRGTDPSKRLQLVNTTHKDNPFYYDAESGEWTRPGRAYLKNLDELEGVMRLRLRDGIWASAEGAIFPQWDPHHHMVHRGDITTEKPFGDNLPDFAYTVGALDLGFKDAAVLQIWGVDHEKRMFRLHERYGTGVELDELASWVTAAYDAYRPKWIDADHRPEVINMLNQRLGRRADRNIGSIVRPTPAKGADSIRAGLDLLSNLMGEPEAGRPPRIFLVRDAAMPYDKKLTAQRKPACTEEEIPSYVWDKDEEDKPVRERPKPGQADHGIDTMRYAAVSVWEADIKPRGRVQDAISYARERARERDFQRMVEAGG